MKAHDVIRSNIQSAQYLVTENLKDLNDSDLFVRPVQGANHIAWQLGHLINSGYTMLEGLTPGSAPKLPSGFKEAYSSERSKSDDTKSFHSKQVYLDLLNGQFEAALAILGKQSDADLDKPGPEEIRDWSPTVGATLSLLGGHITMHIGQFTVVRRKLGKPMIM